MAREVSVARIDLGLLTYALFVRNDGAFPVTERAETAFAVDEEADLFCSYKAASSQRLQGSVTR